MDSNDEPQASTSGSASASREAVAYSLPSTPFYSVEYPGRVKPTSVPEAIRSLGGQASLDSAFRRAASKAESLVELSLRPDNPFSHPIPGEVVASNAILLKVVKRKKKEKTEGAEDGFIGEYTTEAVGVIPKTIRFRSLADYQYQPDVEDPMSKLRMSMSSMDVEAIRAYRFPEEKADYMVPANPSPPSSQTLLPPTSTSDPDFEMNLDPQLLDDPKPAPASDSDMRSNLRLFPPPIFSRQTIPQVYNYKANTASIVSTTVDEETGEEKKRLINRMRWKGYGPATISFTDTTVPDKPPQNVEAVRAQVDQRILEKLEEAREIHKSFVLFIHQLLLPLVCYVFQDGPWRDTLVKFSYDPRKHTDARLFQRLYFRNANHPIARPSVATRRQDRSATNAFLEHGVDKDLERSDLRETCDERDGWPCFGINFFSLLDGHIATDEECRNLLAAHEGSTSRTVTSSRNAKLRSGKHNMAKGALRPEDAAALRLRATLDRNAKNIPIQR
ncbi:RNA polymerase III transcription factor IIIC subunit-domain-containing protein [Desarmillaria tabescens]|uniref:RNA polymerase III transcription factor IIIC subunit-domain-containing protein n=1 Tax=Armillaria tabescens TaxID=1929756 RepID=A0AA39NLZ6_ARMTA|nr:RNA polymerase III transcription factor IIIC subunit-domain-containing protein [Desarmillaria tabescens]KAK0468020.1 RNA polymerase III transcription factor IIIC subunit-domain-containing protein [Desarmillaria tabescens]